MLQVLTSLYNAVEYIPRCIASLKAQSVEDFRCYILDDVSTAGSGRLAKRFVEGDRRFEVVGNTAKRHQPGNYQQILGRPEIDDEDVIVTVDGDDWLPDRHVFARVLRAYED